MLRQLALSASSPVCAVRVLNPVEKIPTKPSPELHNPCMCPDLVLYAISLPR